MGYKLKRMNTHKEDLAKKYWQMKKDSKSEKEQGDEMLAVLVDASQDAIKVRQHILFFLEVAKEYTVYLLLSDISLYPR